MNRPYQLLIDEWYKNARSWKRRLDETSPNDFLYRMLLLKELKRCFRRIAFLKQLQCEEL